MQQLQTAWEQAQAQLAHLREQVAIHAELAQAKVQSGALLDERSIALKGLGEAVWAQVQKGKLQLPAALQGALKTVQEVERRIEKQNQEITDLLRQADEPARRTGKSPLAGKTKKR